MTDARPTVGVDFEPRFCRTNVVDLTAGCSFGCVYCPFSDIAARRRGVSRPTAVDISRLAELPAPPSVYLSPTSDPFAPQAAANTHALLEHVLPRGTVVGILTKGVIPDHTFDLLERYPAQLEGIAVGLASLDDARNRVLEPGCPPAAARLRNIAAARKRGIPVSLRMDPLFPGLDDTPARLEAMIAMAAREGAAKIAATYLFAWGPYLRALRREPLSAPACALLTERAPMEGGMAFSVPLARKLETYAFIAREAARHGLGFSTCGCKDLRVRDGSPSFSTSCRNTGYWAGREATPDGACRVPVGAGLAAPPDGRPT